MQQASDSFTPLSTESPRDRFSLPFGNKFVIGLLALFIIAIGFVSYQIFLQKPITSNVPAVIIPTVEVNVARLLSPTVAPTEVTAPTEQAQPSETPTLLAKNPTPIKSGPTPISTIAIAPTSTIMPTPTEIILARATITVGPTSTSSAKVSEIPAAGVASYGKFFLAVSLVIIAFGMLL